MSFKQQLATLGNVKEREPLSFHTTYKIGGKADFFIEVETLENLKQLIALLNENHIPWLVLGNGSNVLIDDCDYHGVVIALKGAFDAFHFEDDHILNAQAGCSMIKLSFEAMNHSLSGLEFASGIPGSIGGGIYMNAGAYRSDLSEILIDVTILRNGKVETLPKADLNFTYRHSLFQKHKDWIILSARFGLKPQEKTQIKALMDSRKQRRLSTQPVSRPSAGSVFRNPHGMNAWQVVDTLGYRGKAIGQARVSEVHSNFIVNEGNASAHDVDRLIRMIQKDAWEKLGIRLITEVERINWHAETDTLFIA